ncbi:hypothetical protein BSKO_02372 [Bryopsis sp. KO-2023]|nr:hypothetical protein BSKO_02372 [Bryopsis sp. KO-2023]
MDRLSLQSSLGIVIPHPCRYRNTSLPNSRHQGFRVHERNTRLKASGGESSDFKKPFWVRDLEQDAPYDEDAARVLKGTNGDPKKVRENIRREQRTKLEDIFQGRTGESVPVRVYFREVDPFDLWVWFEFYSPPSESDKELFSETLRSWFVVGKLGGYNSSNLQVARNCEDDISYFEYDFEDPDENKLESFFHEMSDVEFQEDCARFRLDMGTADEMALDCLINMLSSFSEEYLGIKKLFIGGENQDWEVPKQIDGEQDQLKGLMDFAAYAKARQAGGSSDGDVKTGQKLKIGDNTYTVEDIPPPS